MILKLHGTYHLLLKVHKGGPRPRSHWKWWSGWSSQCCHLVSYTVVDHLQLLWFMKWCVYYCMYLHFMPFKSVTWSLYRSKAMWRLMAESPAWNAVKTMFFNWIGMGDVTDLEGHLERSSTFVSTYLHPDFILGNRAIMPCQPVFPWNI